VCNASIGKTDLLQEVTEKERQTRRVRIGL